MWTGSLAFGLVNVPVKMYTGTEDHSVRFHQVHAADGGRIKMKRFCSECGMEVAYSEIGKGYEDASGQRIVFEAGDFDDLPQGPKKEVEVLEFVPSDQVDPILYDKTYYLEPDGRALKPYVLLRQALESTERTAIVKVAIRQRTQLAALRVRDEVLVLQTMLWPDEVREPDFGFIGEEVDIRPQELQMAQSLVENLSADFDPDQYTDDYREAILQVIEAKLSGGEGIPVSPEGEVRGGAAEVVDLMAALRASIAETNPAATAEAERTAHKRSAPKAAAKTAAKTGTVKTGTAKARATKSAATKATATKAAPAAGRAAKPRAGSGKTAASGAATSGSARKAPAARRTTGKTTTAKRTAKAATAKRAKSA